MPNRDDIIEAVRTHCRAESALDKDTWLALFADDIVIEDPVGLRTTRGIEAVSTDFWASVENARPRIELLEDVIVCGQEAVAILSAEINSEAGRITIAPIVVNFVYDEAGKVRRLRSFMNYG
ncbi:MAG: nuclear transport factor 2 family protein [Novosphingobium sp.]|nr:nuclear transport factor 2 family protein [Novosphingobium sp.]